MIDGSHSYYHNIIFVPKIPMSQLTAKHTRNPKPSHDPHSTRRLVSSHQVFFSLGDVATGSGIQQFICLCTKALKIRFLGGLETETKTHLVGSLSIRLWGKWCATFERFCWTEGIQWKLHSELLHRFEITSQISKCKVENPDAKNTAKTWVIN